MSTIFQFMVGWHGPRSRGPLLVAVVVTHVSPSPDATKAMVFLT